MVSSNGLGFVIVMLNDDAATVAAELIFAMDPEMVNSAPLSRGKGRRQRHIPGPIRFGKFLFCDDSQTSPGRAWSMPCPTHMLHPGTPTLKPACS